MRSNAQSNLDLKTRRWHFYERYLTWGEGTRHRAPPPSKILLYFELYTIIVFNLVFVYFAEAPAGNSPPAKIFISKLYIRPRRPLKMPHARNYGFRNCSFGRGENLANAVTLLTFAVPRMHVDLCPTAKFVECDFSPTAKLCISKF
jgi:hypothetical protein